MKDGLTEGGEAFGMGFYRGVTGIVTKPLEGAKSRGAYGAYPRSQGAILESKLNPMISFMCSPLVIPHGEVNVQRTCILSAHRTGWIMS